MGKKVKSAPRTKDNAKPSSSARSAELLQNTPVVFASLAVQSPFASNELSSDRLETAFSPEWQIVLRKLNKKDATTKKKGLQDLIEYIKDSDLETCKQFLPCWAELYSSLATDADHSVRQLSQSVIKLLIDKCKRHSTPYLKQLVPVWIASQFDNYTSAANLATSSFNSTFEAANRIQEVCLYCQAEILEYFLRNLTVLSQSNCTNVGKAVPPEEAKQIYEQLVLRSLRGLTFYIRHTANSPKFAEGLDTLNKIVAHQKFWAYAKSKDWIPSVRAAWFEFIENGLSLNIGLMDSDSFEKRKRFVTICFQNLDDADAATVQYVWMCILFLQQKHNDWFHYVNMRKAVLPKLYALIQNGFNRNAQKVCPHLLTFFSHITQESLQDYNLQDFYEKWFASFKVILTAEFNPQQLYKHDYKIISKTYFESFKLLISFTESNLSLLSFTKNIFKEGPIELLRKYLQNKHCFNLQYVFEFSSTVVVYCDRQKTNLHRELLDTFWATLFELACSFEKESEQLSQCLQLMHCLHKAKSNSATDDNCVEAEIKYIDNELKSLAQQLSEICIRELRISDLNEIVLHYSDKRYFESYTAEKTLPATLEALESLLHNLEGNNLNTLILIICKILRFLDESDRYDRIAKLLLKTPEAKVLNIILQDSLSDQSSIEMNTVLSLAVVNDIIKNVELDIRKGNFSLEQKKLLNLIMGHSYSEKLPLPTETVDDVIMSLMETLNENNEESYMRLIADYLPNIYTNDNCSKSVQRLVFIQNFKCSVEKGKLSASDSSEFWPKILDNNYINVNKSILHECAAIMDYRILRKDTSVYTLKELTNLAATLTERFFEHLELDSYKEYWLLALLASGILTKSNVLTLEKYTLYAAALRGKVTPVDSIVMKNNFSEFAPLMQRILFNLSILRAFNVNAVGSEQLFSAGLKCVKVSSLSNILLSLSEVVNISKELIETLVDSAKCFIRHSAIANEIENFFTSTDDKSSESCFMKSCVIVFLQYSAKYANFEENAVIVLHEEISDKLCAQEQYSLYIELLQLLLPQLSQGTLTLNKSTIMLCEPPEQWMKAAVYRCLILNNFAQDSNTQADKAIIDVCIQFIGQITEKVNELKVVDLVYYMEPRDLVNVVECLNLLSDVISNFPYQLSTKNWDNVRLALASWVLSVSKSVEHYADSMTSLFIVRVYKIFAAFTKLIREQKQKSSTGVIADMIDEWENIFAREVNVLVFKSCYILMNLKPADQPEHFPTFFAEVLNVLEFVDYRFIYQFCKAAKISNRGSPNQYVELDFKKQPITLDNLCAFFLNNLTGENHQIRIKTFIPFRELIAYFIADDTDAYNNGVENFDKELTEPFLLTKFNEYLLHFTPLIVDYNNEFSFKTTELDGLRPIDESHVSGYLLMWDCIVYACGKAPVPLRNVYTNWLSEHKHEEIFLHFLFRAMPAEILRNHCNKICIQDICKELIWANVKDPQLALNKYVFHLYIDVLHTLPAMVRKWWSSSPSRQKNFVDSLTTNYASSIIYNEELKAIAQKPKHHNMQVNVHTSTREVIAIYTIEETQQELAITLAHNYPLGCVKVDCRKALGGRASSRNQDLQLTILLTHQNGSIYDGLTLWKNNLDKKYEGVEECYICYMVVNQDTCQLPKLTCKTCKKKFHGSCLYKWFTMSSKSTCPICRNIF